MKFIQPLILFLSLFLNSNSFTQKLLSGTYQGIIYQREDRSDAQPIYIEMEVVKGLIDAKIRYEQRNGTNFTIIKINGSVNENKVISLQEQRVLKQNHKEKNDCFRLFECRLNDSTGYIEGDFVSKKCPTLSGKLVLYSTSIVFSEKNEPLLPHSWVTRLVKDLEGGLSSPEKRKEELMRFSFQPVYFDYDKFELKSEYHDYLLKIVKMVKSHSDLRIIIIGHTDGDGSDKYNLKLSKKRTETVAEFLVNNGLSRDRIDIDYKGKRQPIGSNKSENGKQLNRRVDFAFH
ncbi:MAG: hypothetical protein RL264_776 [Bacteroidota bacterium]|jgi:outer membrane protein OmpA-like peptidoglycan-associated protein